MKTSSFTHIAKSVAATLVLCGLTCSAFAFSTNLVDACVGPNDASRECDAVTVSAWSTPNATAGAFFAAATVYEYSTGLGVVGSGESAGATGQHATDNKDGTDALLLSFDSLVTLTQFTIGWNGTDNPTGRTSSSYRDSDISVLAWTGDSNPASPADFRPSAMTGWTLIGNYKDVGSLSNNTRTLTTSQTSSYWLISAYNSAYGGTPITNRGSADTRIDAFKLYSIAGNTQPPDNPAPEPGSIALLGLGLVGMFAVRRRKQASM
jgi:hypothetical protein